MNSQKSIIYSFWYFFPPKRQNKLVLPQTGNQRAYKKYQLMHNIFI